MKEWAKDKTGNWIHIHKAVNNPIYHNKREPLYFNGVQVVPVSGSKNNHYRFDTSSNPSKVLLHKAQHYSEHILHRALKMAIAESERLKMLVYGEKYIFSIEDAVVEDDVSFEDSIYRPDIHCTCVAEDGMNALFGTAWIEVKYKHKIEHKKYNDAKKMDLFLFEIDVNNVGFYKNIFQEMKDGKRTPDVK